MEISLNRLVKVETKPLPTGGCLIVFFEDNGNVMSVPLLTKEAVDGFKALFSSGILVPNGAVLPEQPIPFPFPNPQGG